MLSMSIKENYRSAVNHRLVTDLPLVISGWLKVDRRSTARIIVPKMVLIFNIRTSALYPSHPQIISAIFVRILHVGTSAFYPRPSIAPWEIRSMLIKLTEAARRPMKWSITPACGSTQCPQDNGTGTDWLLIYPPHLRTADYPWPKSSHFLYLPYASQQLTEGFCIRLSNIRLHPTIFATI